jgi:Ca2+-binding RTX toxin-like protein
MVKGIVTASLAGLMFTSLSVQATAAAPRCGGQRATIVGTAGDDVIRGTRDHDVIYAGAGNDLVKARAGYDVVCGGRGRDTVRGGDGNDYLWGGRGRDRLVAGHPIPPYRCPPNADCVGPGEVLLGQGAADVIVGSSGSDDLIGGRGDDVLRGKDGDDRLDGRDDDDRMFGGPGGDVVEFGTAARGVRVDLRSGTATGSGTDLIRGVEGIWGSPFADLLLGSEGSDEIWGRQEGAGRDGDDVIIGRGGPDYLFGYSGADTLRGGGGWDLLNGDYTRNLPGPDRLFGGDGRDLCYYGERYRSCERRSGQA